MKKMTIDGPRQIPCSQWDMFWYCDCCHRVFERDTYGYISSSPRYFLCDRCKDKSPEKIKEERTARKQTRGDILDAE